MKKIDVTGWKDVFLFTFKQTIKAKSYLITLVIFCVIVAVGIPVYCSYTYGKDTVVQNADNVTEQSMQGMDDDSALLMNNGKAMSGEADSGKTDVSGIDTVYISYDREEALDKLSDTIRGRYSCNIEYLAPAKVNSLSDSLNDNNRSCIIKINKNDGIYSIETISGWDTTDSYEDMKLISDDIASELDTIQRSHVISDEYTESEDKRVTSYVDGNEAADDSGIMLKYGIWLAYISIMVFIVTFSGQAIANSIVTEKSSRLVEYLLVTIRPMALVVGKTLAILLSLLVQIAAILTSAGLSVALSGSIINTDVVGSVASIIDGLMNEQALQGLNPGSVILAILVIFTGLIFFALVAGIAGAAVSKIEELTEGSVMFTMLVIVGAYMSLALAMGNLFTDSGQLNGGYAYVCCLLPISSVFTIPVNLIMGSIPVWIAIAALAILLVCACIVLVASSKIYEYLLFYNGVTLKIKDIIHIIRYGRVKEGR